MHILAKTRIALLTAATFLASSTIAQAQAVEDYNKRDLGYFEEWFEGEWDNDEQTYFQGDRRWLLDEKLRHQHVRVIHKRVDLPIFGDRVFYVEHYVDNDPEKIVRQELAVITSNPKEHTWTQDVYTLNNPNPYRKGYWNLDKFKNLQMGDVKKQEGCSIIWRRETGQYEGKTEGNSCRTKVGSKDARLVRTMAVSETRQSFTDRAFDPKNGKLVMGHVTEDAFELRKITEYYSCTMRFMEGFYDKEGHRAANYKDGEDQLEGPFVVPSHGGEFSAVRKKDGLTYSGRIRNREYPYYPRGTDFTVLQARMVEANGETNQFAWSVIDAGGGGIVLALGWLTYNCNKADAPY